MNLQNRRLLTVLLLSSFLFFNFGKKQPETFTLKKFEKTLGEVTPKLYASKYEVSNLQYNTFLNDLQSKKETKKLEIARIDSTQWRLSNSYNEPLVETYGNHPAYDHYPVVNITQAGAKLFCEWLTEKYNSYEKRKFQKVIFRLPTEEEWITAAKGGNEHAIFPWGGYYIRNAKGLILANFRRYGESNLKAKPGEKMVEVMPFDLGIGKPGAFTDRAFITAPVASFHPNDFGLHNMSGNVSEMLAEEGRTKGGSWRSSGYYIRINAEDEFKGFTHGQPTIGFRYFMEIIK